MIPPNFMVQYGHTQHAPVVVDTSIQDPELAAAGLPTAPSARRTPLGLLGMALPASGPPSRATALAPRGPIGLPHSPSSALGSLLVLAYVSVQSWKSGASMMFWWPLLRIDMCTLLTSFTSACGSMDFIKAIAVGRASVGSKNLVDGFFFP